MQNNKILKNIIEVLIFSSDKPLSLKEIKDIVNQEKEISGFTADIKSIEQSLNELIDKYSSDEYSFEILRIAGAFRFATKKDYAPWLAKLSKEKAKRRLSQSALETLAIIAYNQPITKPEIESIRGVNVDYIMGTLLEKDLVTIKGRAEAPGRPMLYATTDTFLEYMGVNLISDLPSLKGIEDIIKSGPPEGVSQSDIDFYEEINLMKAKIADKNANAENIENTQKDEKYSSSEMNEAPEPVNADAFEDRTISNDEPEQDEFEKINE